MNKATNSITTKITQHKGFFITILVVSILDILVITFKPVIPAVDVLQNTYPLLTLSIQAVILSYTIGIYLFYRWFKTGRSNVSTLSWSLAFLIYGILFAGLVLQSFGFSWANMNDPTIFFLYRHVMIIWTALMYYGVSHIITREQKWHYLPTLFILISGYIIFTFGLLYAGDIELTMYIFLYSVWVPICVLVIYLFWLYGINSNTTSPKIISLGFVVLAITYLLWAPTHTSFMYYIAYAFFVLSLVCILIGFVILPYEITILRYQE
ncbi:MAG: hypothetical protein GF364_19995 [Candidatus Lokiarchaeota archaeon]|nr:hypothetical protein [Candidatus Lokiarchaeota archaeon]